MCSFYPLRATNEAPCELRFIISLTSSGFSKHWRALGSVSEPLLFYNYTHFLGDVIICGIKYLLHLDYY